MEGTTTQSRSTVGLLIDVAVVLLTVTVVAFALAAIERVVETRLFQVNEAQAAPLKGFESVMVTSSGSGKIILKPGETKSISVGFQNIGSETWKNDGPGFVSIYTYVPKYRTSVFADSSWYKAGQPAKLTESIVAPGSVGHLVFTIRAPKTESQYAESFALAAEDKAWIPGGGFTLNIVVTSSVPTVTPATVSTPTPASPASSPTPTPYTLPPTPSSTTGLSGLVIIRSAKTVSAKGGESIAYTVGVKNTGTSSWNRREVRVPDVSIASSGSETQDPSWLSSSVLVAKADAPVAPGGLDLMSFSFRAPAKAGSHTVKYVLAVDNAVVPDLMIDIPVEVTSDAPEIFRSPEKIGSRNDSRVVMPTVDLIPEPTVRIGVLIVDEETDNQVIVSCQSSWKLFGGDGGLLAEMKKGESVEAFYKKNRYWFNRGKGLEQTMTYLRFVPDEPNAVCQIENFNRVTTRNAAYPDNEFRNILELRYNDAKDRTWLINELSVEMYLRGLGETSNISHLEFQKTLVTVARTYATYHWERATKHDEEFFHMTAYADDQVYRGYGQEKRSPRIVQSVMDTTGIVVMYQGKTAITPYFSRSDGRTRDWGEVWYGTVDWLKGVPCPCDKGKTLWGHGVGLSASEALCQANNGKEWKDILKYFYTGIDLTKRWN